ncbi:cyanophycinase [Brevibacillus sp. SYSU BS000544]|uniref:cyanophycinase n=1 Tax=Brevibacillus sp. SYSU BS000544 TaxID=3416443 RepID=UPI003CE59826
MRTKWSVSKMVISTVLSAGHLLSLGTVTAAPAPYSYYTHGNATDVSTATSFGEVFMGGSTDVDEAFVWMSEKANGGDFLILRASGTDAYNPYIYDLAQTAGTPLNSVNTLIVNDLAIAGSHSFVIDKINHAEAIFFAGGNQADYVNFLKGTPALDALNNRIAQGIPFGGTSAGLAIQGEHSYDAIATKSKTLDSPTALNNPYNSLISLTHGLIETPVNGHLITDSHFEQRDRMGRFLTFLARNIQDGFEAADQAKGMAVNEMTALLVEQDGTATVVVQPGATNPGVYMAQSNQAPSVCQNGTPLTFTNISIYKLTEGDSFNLNTWTGSGGLSYSVNVNNGVVTSSTGNIYGTE